MSSMSRTTQRAFLAAVTAAALSVPLLPVAHADTAGDPVIPADLAAAQSSALSSGNPVVVTDQTTATQQVTALPDGTFELQADQQPVRVKTSRGWTAIDTTLHQQADGTIAPAAIDGNVAFSGGGSGPAIILGDTAHHVTFALPTALPTPVLTGPTATYPDVYPGVDLDLTANATGYSEVLVVKNAAAATNPALRNLTIKTSTTGVDLTRDSNGNLAVAGDAIPSYTAEAPIMWDSSSNLTVGPAPTATAPGSAQVTSLSDTLTTDPTTNTTNGTNTTTGDLTVSAPATALTGSNITYPLYIDPGFTAGLTQWLTVSSGGIHHYKTTDNLEVGRCQTSWAGCGSIGVARSFFTLNLATLAGGTGTAHISAASIAADEISSAYSAPTPVNLIHTGNFSSSTTWPGPSAIGSVVQTVSSDKGHVGIAAGNIFFDNSTVVSLFQAAANSHASGITFGLEAPDESTSSYQWKQFKNDPSATVYFDFAPSTPSNLSLLPNQEVKCGGKPIYATTPDPSFTAHSEDNNPAGHTYPVGILFHLDSYAGTTYTWDRDNETLITADSAGNATWDSVGPNSTKTTALTQGTWKLEAKATSMSTNSTPQSSPWSGWYTFIYDHTGPATPTTYTINADGTITINTPGAVGVTWSNISSALTTPTNTTCSYNTASASGGFSPVTNGAVTIPAPPRRPPTFTWKHSTTHTTSAANSTSHSWPRHQREPLETRAKAACQRAGACRPDRGRDPAVRPASPDYCFGSGAGVLVAISQFVM